MKWLRIVAPVFLLVSLAMAADEPEKIPLWPNGAPGSEARRNEPEIAREYWVRNIHNPSITVFLPPKEKANGAAVVIFPGGGHRELVFNAEGVEPARYLNTLGVAAFAVKYRLARETNSPYKIEIDARADGERAMRLVRSRAAAWGIDPRRIGIMGFSAGGEMVSMVAYGKTEGNPQANDPVDQVSCRPDFQISIYPGPLGVPDVIPSDAPPAFFAAASDDQGPARLIASLLPKYRAAKVPMEAHLFAHGGHGFNMGYRSKLASIKSWPQLLDNWLADNWILDPDKPAKTPQPH